MKDKQRHCPTKNDLNLPPKYLCQRSLGQSQPTSWCCSPSRYQTTVTAILDFLCVRASYKVVENICNTSLEMYVHRRPWILVTVWLHCFPFAFSITTDVCIGYDFQAACQPGEIIVMEEAEFGRMGPGKCISADRGNFGCKNDVLFLADQWCSGRKDCQFNVPNQDIMEANTDCIEVLAFLRASYSCVRVVDPEYKRCSSSSPNTITASEGILSSHLTQETRCGSRRSPWRIEAKAGQTIEISLLDFKALTRARSHSLVTCSDVYGFIVERSLNINQTICGQTIRENRIYTSKTNTVEVFLSENTNNMNFLLKYKTNGCSDPVPPLHAWYKRNGNEAVIGCEDSDREWRLTCTGNTWQGQTGNCSHAVTAGREHASPESGPFEFFTIVIVAGIIGGTIVLAVAVIVCGVVYIQKYKDKLEKKYNEQHPVQCEGTLPTMSRQTHYKPISSSATESQDEYLQPNTDDVSTKKTPCKPEEPLIHIWETPLPDPNTDQSEPSQGQCTIHRHNSSKKNGLQGVVLTKQGTVAPGASYYSPRTGHKYYIIDRDK